MAENPKSLLIVARVWHGVSDGTVLGRVRIFNGGGRIQSDTPVAGIDQILREVAEALARFEGPVLDLTADHPAIDLDATVADHATSEESPGR